MMMNDARSPLVSGFSLTGWRPAAISRDIPIGEGSARDHLNPLERLVRIAASNDRLAGELAKARHRVNQALAYASDPLSGRGLGAALVAHARKKQSEIFAQLRSNRSEALAILASPSPSVPASC